jgi:hypothetical protein
MIQTYRGLSGCHWDNESGAGIEGEAAAAVWGSVIGQKVHRLIKNCIIFFYDSLLLWFIQAYRGMRPFHNSGWPYFAKFESILPQSVAKGTHVYAPASAGPAPNDSDAGSEKGSLEVGLPPGAASMSDGGTGAVVAVGGNMDIETDMSISESALSFASKRKRSLITIDDINSTCIEDTPSKGAAPDDSMPLSGLLDKPLQKKTTSQMSSSRLTSSANSPASSSAAVSDPQRKITSTSKVTPAVAISNMQGSINRLTDIFEKSMTAPILPQHEDKHAKEAADRNRALEQLQTQWQNDGLTENDVTDIINIFMVDLVLVQTYLALMDDKIRRRWLQSVLEKARLGRS